MGERGSGEGQFTNPTNSTLDGQGNFYVADAEGGRIQKFKLPDSPDPVSQVKSLQPCEFRSPQLFG